MKTFCIFIILFLLTYLLELRATLWDLLDLIFSLSIFDERCKINICFEKTCELLIYRIHDALEFFVFCFDKLGHSLCGQVNLCLQFIDNRIEVDL